ncbi:unnamed protein product (macronuclear) [Paramecium tetraurelia]|uniref:Uncharacterized protein n=1 Tax=Paramecium tetraurelia TaxID=5888 RepID=A0DQS4_PARTE|nr:uncharacterized protein GSPATT00002791001 [Paramecium tetraurelia]CAK85391.1 unnamed protein product [Paramecium tetraurelia]|eukprot:XP_001452788.1 hypothetical protein (macronuclear) [Paramecium tetraurelia strain d4-2]
MNKEQELIENSLYFQDILEENIESNDFYLYETTQVVQQPVENKNFTLINILGQMNINENVEMLIEEPNY